MNDFDAWIRDLQREFRQVSYEKRDDGSLAVAYVDCYTDGHAHRWHHIDNWREWKKIVWPAMEMYFA